LLECLGQVLAEDVTSDIDVPPADNAAMDGYAVRYRDTLGASQQTPRVLSVIGTVAAGSIFQGEVRPGTAVRIMTGAPVPPGADSVVRFEDTDELERRQATTGQSPAEIGILCEAEANLNIRQAGEDISRGALVLAKGTIVRPAEVGVLASLGRNRVKVIRRPVIAVLATGDELVDIGQPLPPGKIYNSNTYSVAALVLRYGGIPKILGIARDNEASLVDKLHQGQDTDMLITSGGVSAGDYDMVKNVLAREGEISFWTVRMKPGKPLAFGTLRGKGKKGTARNIPHLGLPGNPVSSMVTFELFVRPSILKMMGKKNLAKPTVTAVMEDSLTNSDGRRFFARAIVTERDGKYYARSTGPQGSGILTSMSSGNGLVIIPEDEKGVGPGDIVTVMMLDWSRE
ncbi:MAG: molybdopterin molybdotransferase MoeA, partial [Dehalococcoidales bacterium]|nr:molybdopterin molybdotransferase MoeA [Dehalococcoidales bacterium]